MRIFRIFCAVALISALLSATASAQLLGRIFDEEEWTEQQARLPAFPKPENLVPVPIDVVKAFEFRIDASSIDIGQDGVIRYTLVARSSSGSENISFEGIRCDTSERKLYAFGRANKTWAQARTVGWMKYVGVGRSYQSELAAKFFCPDAVNVRNVAEALENMKKGGFVREFEPLGE